MKFLLVVLWMCIKKKRDISKVFQAGLILIPLSFIFSLSQIMQH